ncbi:hypothetical protein FOZ63_003398 [Perkinsus olseni]|uniref:Uncharacterized protein n=1 Tax=Perkinsus olseni TaxID=32597 RepID=A0A7J6QFY4_PEROL|nr:hypothetical protein FOZ63_003398 [Perkinsus olseni]
MAAAFLAAWAAATASSRGGGRAPNSAVTSYLLDSNRRLDDTRPIMFYSPQVPQCRYVLSKLKEGGIPPPRILDVSINPLNEQLWRSVSHQLCAANRLTLPIVYDPNTGYALCGDPDILSILLWAKGYPQPMPNRMMKHLRGAAAAAAQRQQQEEEDLGPDDIEKRINYTDSGVMMMLRMRKRDLHPSLLLLFLLPSRMSRPIDALTRLIVASPHRLWILSVALWMAGMVWLTIFHQLDRPTEIEEHSLAPGLASFALDDPNMSQQWSQLLSQRRPLDGSDSIFGVTTYKFTNYSLPFSMVRSKRGDGREAVVVVVTGDPSHAEALGSTLTRLFSTVNWLSKDVIIVFAITDDALRPASYAFSIRQWLHDSTMDWHGDHDIPSIGIIRQCVVVNLTMQKGRGILVEVDGINGMQPNQDWPNAYIIEARRSGIDDIKVDEVWESVLKQSMMNGNVHSLHAPFLTQQIPAFTVTTYAATNIKDLAKSIEGIVHCSSSMLQQLHHSFNVYFYNTPTSHVSNGIFLYPTIAILSPLIVKAFPIRRRSLPLFLTSIALVLCLIISVGSPLMLALITAASRQDPQCRGLPDHEDDDGHLLLLSGSFISFMMMILMSIIYRRVEQYDKLGKEFWISLSSAASFIYLTLSLPLVLINWSVPSPVSTLTPCLVGH